MFKQFKTVNKSLPQKFSNFDNFLLLAIFMFTEIQSLDHKHK